VESGKYQGARHAGAKKNAQADWAVGGGSRMKKQEQIERIEKALLAAERPDAAPTAEWQKQVMARVRQVAQADPKIIEFPAMRFAVVAAAAALLALCFGVWFYQTNWMMESMTVDVYGGLAQVISGI